MNQKRFLLIVFSLIIAFPSCREINTNDPIQAYKYWANMKPNNEVTVINGQYWESAHWSKEYRLFLEVEASKEWIEEFIEINKLGIDTTGIKDIQDAPTWFKPSMESIHYKLISNYPETSFYVDKSQGKQFIYILQL